MQSEQCCERLGYLTVTGSGTPRGGRPTLRCVCDCGVIKEILARHVRSGRTKSCGCRRTQSRVSHGHSKIGKRTPTYSAWRAMIARCKYPGQGSFARYGGRGISVCRRWGTFANFLADMGVRPAGMTLDRRDVNGNYEPGNVRWATSQEQAQNCRTNSLSPSLVLEIVGRHEHGESTCSIARRMGIGRTSAQKVISGDTWSNISGIRRDK